VTSPAPAAKDDDSASAASTASSAAASAASPPFHAADSLRDASVKLLASLKDEAAREALYAAIAPQVSAGVRDERTNHSHQSVADIVIIIHLPRTKCESLIRDILPCFQKNASQLPP
jgi:hypothetical protein